LENYPYIGKTVARANLRHLHGLFLFQIERDNEIIAPVGPDQVIQEGDRLFFTGLTNTLYELQKTPGLSVVGDRDFALQNLDSDKVKTYEAVISAQSPLIGVTVRDSDFRKRYDGVILAIHRSGQRVNKKVGDIVFQPSDTLFILGKRALMNAGIIRLTFIWFHLLWKYLKNHDGKAIWRWGFCW